MASSSSKSNPSVPAAGEDSVMDLTDATDKPKTRRLDRYGTEDLANLIIRKNFKPMTL